MQTKRFLVFAAVLLCASSAFALDEMWGTNESFGAIGYGSEQRDLRRDTAPSYWISEEARAQMRSDLSLAEPVPAHSMNVWGTFEDFGPIGYSATLRQAGDPGGHVIYREDERLVRPSTAMGAEVRGRMDPGQMQGDWRTGTIPRAPVYKFNSAASQQTIDDMMDNL